MEQSAGSTVRNDAAERARSLLSVDLFLAGAYVVAHLAYFSTLTNAIVPGLDRLALLLMTLAIAGGVARALWLGEWLAALLAIAAIGLVAAQLAIFAQLSDRPINWNAGLPYLSLAGFVLFVNAWKQRTAMLALLIGAAFAYCAIYVALAGMVAASGVLGGALVLAGDDRGPRLVLANGYAALAFFAALVRCRQGPVDWRWLGLLIVVLATFALAQSRAFSAVAALVAVLYLLGLTGGIMRWLLAIAFTVAIGGILFGAAVPTWNPFDLVAIDLSGAARANGYGALQPLLANHPLTGIGLPTDRAAFDAFVGRPFVYWEDLGPFGIWAAFGAIGLIAYLLIAYRCILAEPDEGRFSQILSLAALTIALYSVISPALWSGSASIVANLVLACWLTQRRSRIERQ
ncbi:hypothetical protein [Paradevosia shaoguanensis]|uniref:hypothetical protein n=1 Tax=Paradevosia shaoguanensis TaxID=1335043 RepID=UPI0019314606|nr:hypothetical protein [Paradevosia shaoguanensis]